MNFKFLFLLVLFSVSFIFSSGSNLGNISLVGSLSQVYTDSKDFNVVFSNITPLDAENTYLRIISPPSAYKNPFVNVNYCTPTGSNFCSSISDNIYHLKDLSQTYTTKFRFELKDDFSSFESFNLNWAISSSQGGICSDCSPFAVNLVDGKPDFTIAFKDLNSNEEFASTDSFAISKASNVQIILKSLKDNQDDKGGQTVKCSASFTGNNFTRESTFTDIAITPKDKDLGAPFSLENLGGSAGEFDLSITCNDGVNGTGGLSTIKTAKIKFEDVAPKITSINITPSSIYPDSTQIKCIAQAVDVDDIGLITIDYSWRLKGALTTNITDTFNCEVNKCESYDKLTCIATPNNAKIGQSVSKEIEISSRFSNVSISGPSIVQVGETTSFRSLLNYNGSGSTKYSWSLGDGKTYSTKDISHKFDRKGNFTINLKLEDNKRSTYNVTKQVSVVDPNIIIDIKNPTSSQTADKGSQINVKVQIKDNTGQFINNAKVSAKFIHEDTNFPSNELVYTPSSTGLYEVNIEVPYIVSENPEIEIEASYKKGNETLVTKKRVTIYTPPVALNPIFILDTEYPEEDDKISSGNTINSVEVCFAFTNNSFSKNLVSPKLIIQNTGHTFDLIKQNNCYFAYIDFYIDSKYDELVFKFNNNLLDGYSNYIDKRNSYEKKYEVIPLPSIFNVVLIDPKVEDLINYNQKLKLSFRAVPNQGHSLEEVTNLKGYLLYKGLKIELDKDKDIFSKTLDIGTDSQVSIDVFVEGLVENAIMRKNLNLKFNTTNKINAKLVSPTESGVIKYPSKLVFDLRYNNNSTYLGEELKLLLNDKEYTLSKRSDGFFEVDYPISILNSYDFKIRGEDEFSNNFSMESQIPTTSYIFSFYVYIILIFLTGLVTFLSFFLIKFSSTQRKLDEQQKSIMKAKIDLENKAKGKSLEELDLMLETKKQEKKSLINKYFKERAMPESEFKAEILSIDSTIKVLEEKISNFKEDSPEELIDKDDAIRELIKFFRENNWDEIKVRSYLRQEGIDDSLADYIVRSLKE